MASTSSRPREREVARELGGTRATEHKTKIMAITTVSIVIILGVLTVTPIGHVIDLAVQHFMLFYAGVVVLMSLCTSVAFGMIATDRMFLHPGQRVFIQAAHRAVSFGSFAFLIIHVITEILAQRANVIDVFIPFLEPFKAFYIGLGTIAGDIMIVLVITGIMRGRFNANGKAWRWRAIHYSAYVCFVFGIWHGLLAGRAAKPYYDWTYGVIITLALFGLAARALSTSLRPKEALSVAPVSESASSAAAPLRAAVMLSQYGATMRDGRSSIGSAMTGAQTMITAAPATATVTAVAALPAAGPATGPQPMQPMQPVQYEPGYEGPARRMGAPRNTGSMPRSNTGAMPVAAAPMDARGSGAYPTQEMPAPQDWGTGAMPRTQTGGMPRTQTGGMPRMHTGGMPQYDDGWGPQGPRGQAGPPQRGGTGAMPAWDDPRMDPRMDPRQRPMTGEMPRLGGHGDYPQDWDRGGRGQGRPQDQGWPQDQGYDRGPDPRWMEASHDGGGRYAEEPQWDNGGYYSEADPRMQYGEPGYGARDQRYGGDRY